MRVSVTATLPEVFVNIVQFCDVGCRKGRPALSTTPEKMYSKQDTKKRVVFSEFLMLDFICPILGGIYLLRRLELGLCVQQAPAKRTNPESSR